VAPHEVRWSVWTPKDAAVSGVEAVVVTPGAAQAEPAACDPDANASTPTRSYWSCAIFARQGQQAVRARAVNAAGASEWTEVDVMFTRGSCTDAVAAAGACEAGDTGPSGGIVFYDAGSRQSWGQYLEAAPVGWSGSETDPSTHWCSRARPGFDRLLTSEEIGSGAANTRLIIENCGSMSAAALAAEYRGGGKADWFLASKDEMGKMYDRRTEVGGMVGNRCPSWSSTQGQSSFAGSNTYNQAWALQNDGRGGIHELTNKSIVLCVRPVRAF
jgi:hypothetical protein